MGPGYLPTPTPKHGPLVPPPPTPKHGLWVSRHTHAQTWVLGTSPHPHPNMGPGYLPTPTHGPWVSPHTHTHTWALGTSPHPHPDMGPGYLPTPTPKHGPVYPPLSCQDIGPRYPLILTPSDGHRNTYGGQAGGTHPTLMLSCFTDFRKQELVTILGIKEDHT